MGVVAEIKHVVKNPHGNLSVVFEGLYRAKIGPVKEVDS
jgi:ATP-dependent Lon protease